MHFFLYPNLRKTISVSFVPHYQIKQPQVIHFKNHRTGQVKIHILWIVIMCNLVDGCQHFQGNETLCFLPCWWKQDVFPKQWYLTNYIVLHTMWLWSDYWQHNTTKSYLFMISSKTTGMKLKKCWKKSTMIRWHNCDLQWVWHTMHTSHREQKLPLIR